MPATHDNTHCPCLERAAHPGYYVPVPSTQNTCRADPLHRRDPGDLPLLTQVHRCLSEQFSCCPIWRAAQQRRLSLIKFVLIQARSTVTLWLRSLLA